MMISEGGSSIVKVLVGPRQIFLGHLKKVGDLNYKKKSENNFFEKVLILAFF